MFINILIAIIFQMQLQHKNEIINNHHSTPTLHSIEQSTPVPLPSGECLLLYYTLSIISICH